MAFAKCVEIEIYKNIGRYYMHVLCFGTAFPHGMGHVNDVRNKH